MYPLKTSMSQLSLNEQPAVELSPMQKQIDIMRAEYNSAHNVLTIARTVVQVADQLGFPVSPEARFEVQAFSQYVTLRYNSEDLLMKIHNMIIQSITNTMYRG